MQHPIQEDIGDEFTIFFVVNPFFCSILHTVDIKTFTPAAVSIYFHIS